MMGTKETPQDYLTGVRLLLQPGDYAKLRAMIDEDKVPIMRGQEHLVPSLEWQAAEVPDFVSELANVLGTMLGVSELGGRTVEPIREEDVERRYANVITAMRDRHLWVHLDHVKRGQDWAPSEPGAAGRIQGDFKQRYEFRVVNEGAPVK
jgi:hypothetical protein